MGLCVVIIAAAAFISYNSIQDAVNSKKPENKPLLKVEEAKTPFEISKTLENCNFVLLESNYDQAMLQAGSYPFQLKERIASNYGHLSNDDCAKQLKNLIKKGVERFLLGHLSVHNNFPELAYQNAVSYLSSFGMDINKDYQLEVAPVRNINGKFIEL